MKGFYYLLFFFLLFVFSYADDSNETFYHPESFNFSLNESVGGPHVQLLATVDYFFNTSPENNVSFSFLFPQGFENFSFSCDGLCEGVVNQSTLILTTNNQSGSYHIEILFFFNETFNEVYSHNQSLTFSADLFYSYNGTNYTLSNTTQLRLDLAGPTLEDESSYGAVNATFVGTLENISFLAEDESSLLNCAIVVTLPNGSSENLSTSCQNGSSFIFSLEGLYTLVFEASDRFNNTETLSKVINATNMAEWNIEFDYKDRDEINMSVTVYDQDEDDEEEQNLEDGEFTFTLNRSKEYDIACNLSTYNMWFFIDDLDASTWESYNRSVFLKEDEPEDNEWLYIFWNEDLVFDDIVMTINLSHLGLTTEQFEENLVFEKCKDWDEDDEECDGDWKKAHAKLYSDNFTVVFDEEEFLVFRISYDEAEEEVSDTSTEEEDFEIQPLSNIELASTVSSTEVPVEEVSSVEQAPVAPATEATAQQNTDAQQKLGETSSSSSQLLANQSLEDESLANLDSENSCTLVGIPFGHVFMCNYWWLLIIVYLIADTSFYIHRRRMRKQEEEQELGLQQ